MVLSRSSLSSGEDGDNEREMADFKATGTAVPDPGPGELVGLTGRMTIRIAGGKPFYEFENVVDGVAP
jgi:hypothetical protein